MAREIEKEKVEKRLNEIAELERKMRDEKKALMAKQRKFRRENEALCHKLVGQAIVKHYAGQEFPEHLSRIVSNHVENEKHRNLLMNKRIIIDSPAESEAFSGEADLEDAIH